MRLVIDAQILGAYYRETVLGEPQVYPAPADALFDALGAEDTGYVDTGLRIENEWRAMADSDWFDAWYGGMLSSDSIEALEVPNCRGLIRRLERECGFPRGSSDRWYVSTARQLVRRLGKPAIIVSEDVDFYEPAAKGDSRKRRRVLTRQRGCVTPILRDEGILVRTLAGYYAERGSQST